MPDNVAVGLWVRRFLSDHLIHERGVSRNTQQSYRDTFCLFLPFVSSQLKTAVDRLAIDDLSPNVVSDFLAHLELNRSCSVATRNQRLATLHAFARFTGESSPEHVDWCAQIRQIPFKRGWRKPVSYLEKMKSTSFFVLQIARLNTANEITPCCCFSTIRAHELPRPREL